MSENKNNKEGEPFFVKRWNEENPKEEGSQKRTSSTTKLWWSFWLLLINGFHQLNESSTGTLSRLRVLRSTPLLKNLCRKIFLSLVDNSDRYESKKRGSLSVVLIGLKSWVFKWVLSDSTIKSQKILPMRNEDYSYFNSVPKEGGMGGSDFFLVIELIDEMYRWTYRLSKSLILQVLTLKG